MDLLERIKRIKAEHPFWRYRSVWAWVRHREDMVGNQKGVRSRLELLYPISLARLMSHTGNGRKSLAFRGRL